MPGIFLQMIRYDDNLYIRRKLVQTGHQGFFLGEKAAFAGAFPQYDPGDSADTCILRDGCRGIVSIDRGNHSTQTLRHIQMLMNCFLLRIVLRF